MPALILKEAVIDRSKTEAASPAGLLPADQSR